MDGDPLGQNLRWSHVESQGGNHDTKRHKARTGGRSKANLGQKEAKQQELSEEQFSHMKGGEAAKSLEQQKRKEQK